MTKAGLGDFIEAFQYLMETHKKEEDELFSRASCDRKRGNGLN